MDLRGKNPNPSAYEGIVRIGTTSSVNPSERTARVFLNDVGIMSGELKVIMQTEAWLPEPGDIVLCIYDGTFNGNGYVIGRL